MWCRLAVELSDSCILQAFEKILFKTLSNKYTVPLISCLLRWLPAPSPQKIPAALFSNLNLHLNVSRRGGAIGQFSLRSGRAVSY